MNPRLWAPVLVVLLGSAWLASVAGQPPQQDRKKGPPTQEPDKKGPDKKGFGFGFGGPGGKFGGPGGQVRKLVKQFDRDGDGRLNREERLAAREFLKKQRGGPGGFGGFGGFGGKGKGKGKGFGGPGGFGPPGGFLTRPVIEALDTNKDGKLTKDEVAAGVKKFFTDTDKDKKGTLSEEQLAEGLNRIFPRPGGFRGGPPGGPGGFGPGNMVAGAILRRADTDKKGKVTLKDLQSAAEKLFTESDKNKDGKLDEEEIGPAIAQLFPGPGGFGRPGGPGGFGPPGGPGGMQNREPPKPGAKIKPDEVATYPKAGLFDPTVLRTIFLEFEHKDWEEELADFYRTDVYVPATLWVDGKKYPNVGVRFRGMSSYFRVSPGYKRSMKIHLDFVNKNQRLYGEKTLTLLNGADDPAFMSTVLYSQIARNYIPTPKANWVKLAINGESWGVYVSEQGYHREFTKEFFKSTKGARWKVPGNPGARGGLEYLGDNIEPYRARFTIKSKDDDKSWKALINLCKVLNQTPLDRLEKALEPILDIDGVLWFLAIDNALINNDGYWVRASDYSLYLDPKGKFHTIPHDMNEAFSPAMMMGFGGPGGPGGRGGRGGPGGGGRPGGGGFELDPLIGLDSNNTRMPLRSRLLAVPALKERYLKHVRTIAQDQLDWKKLGPVVAQYRKLIEKEVEADTRKLYTYDAFKAALADKATEAGPGRGRQSNLRTFFEKRREYLLGYPEIKKLSNTSHDKERDTR
jgi:spore coat protein CotH/Ca2+-binding EF-hand superfamily protein